MTTLVEGEDVEFQCQVRLAQIRSDDNPDLVSG